MYQLIIETESKRVNHGVFKSDDEVMAYLQRLYEEDVAFDEDGNTDINISKVQ